MGNRADMPQPDCIRRQRDGNREEIGRCLRASFTCADRDCPEATELLLRLFAVELPADREAAALSKKDDV